MKKAILSFLLFLSAIYIANTQNIDLKIDSVIYKKIDSTSLIMKVYYPPSMKKSKKYPGMVFFSGGGWVQGGSIKQFEPQAKYFASRGIICFLAEYRVEDRHGTTPFEALMDAKSAIRHIRKNAESYNVDPNKIIASGGSAGGQLAAAAALVTSYNDPKDDQSISCIPDALVLFNPVIDNGPGNVSNERIGENYKDFSPLHNIKKGAPPTIIFLGTKDFFTPVETIKYYQKAMQTAGNRCDVFLYEGQAHRFFNYGVSEKYFKKTVFQADRFLISLGYLKGEPNIKKLVSQNKRN